MWCHNTNRYGDTDKFSYDGFYCFVKSTPGSCDWLMEWLTLSTAWVIILPEELRWFREWFKAQWWPGIIMLEALWTVLRSVIKRYIKFDYCYYCRVALTLKRLERLQAACTKMPRAVIFNKILLKHLGLRKCLGLNWPFNQCVRCTHRIYNSKPKLCISCISVSY